MDKRIVLKRLSAGILLHHLLQSKGDIGVSLLKVPRVPRVGNIARMRRELHEALNLSLRIGIVLTPVVAHDVGHVPMEVAEIVLIHHEDVVVVEVVVLRHLARGTRGEGDAVTSQAGFGWGIDIVADFFGRCGSGSYLELGLDAAVAHHLLQHQLSHRAATDVPVTDKEYFFLLAFQRLVESLTGYKYTGFTEKRSLFGHFFTNSVLRLLSPPLKKVITGFLISIKKHISSSFSLAADSVCSGTQD